MKNALLLPLRFLLGLVSCLAVAALLFSSLFLSDLSRGAHLLSRTLAALIDSFPFICLIALFLAEFQPARRPGNMLVSFLFLFLLSAALLSAGTWGLDMLALKNAKTAASAPVQAYRAAVISPMKGGFYWAPSAPEGEAPLLEAVQADFQTPGSAGILSWHRKMNKPSIQEASRTAPSSALTDFIRDGQAVSALLRPRGGFLPRLWIALALSFFFASLWIFPRVSSWPLFGAFLSLAAFRLALLACAAVGSEAFRTVTAGALSEGVAAWLPHAFLTFTGLVLVAWDILASSARKRSGKAAS